MVNTKEILGGAALAWIVFKTWWDKVASDLEPIIKEVEQMALAGTIGPNERKKIVMDTINIYRLNGTIKLNFIEMLLVSKIVDIIARKLPDFDVSKTVKSVTASVAP